MNEIVWFVFHWILTLMETSHLGHTDASNRVIELANEVICKHNAAVNAGGLYMVTTFGPGEYLTDNQCVFLGMLDKKVTYKEV